MRDANSVVLANGSVRDAPSRSHVAMDRLAASRSCLRQALLPPSQQTNEDALPNGRPRRTLLERLGSGWRKWRRHGTPLTAVSMALRLWGGRSAWPGSTEAQESSLGSVVRQHPWVSIAAASAAGAGLVLTRPWRWNIVRGVAFTARLQATDLLVGWLVRAPLQKQLASLFAEWSHPANDSHAEQEVETDGDDPAGMPLRQEPMSASAA
ncbi:MAG: hypothetical protein V4739_02555 [Pseudomonadota bacterium]